MYESRITLMYPQGRAHDETLTTMGPLELGSEFELYGHTWKVVNVRLPRSRYDPAHETLICEISEAALAA